jgi:hypothetical protein
VPVGGADVIEELTDHIAESLAETDVPFFITSVVVIVALVGREFPASDTLIGPVICPTEIPLTLLEALNFPLEGVVLSYVHVFEPFWIDS